MPKWKDSSKPEWIPTHRIVLKSREVLVMAPKGAGLCYSKDEYDTYCYADFERDENGEWLFLGNSFNGKVVKLND